MAVAAEILETEMGVISGGGSEGGPGVICVSEMAEDELNRRCADRFIQSVGSVAIDGQVEVERAVRDEVSPEESTSLMDSLHRAAWGEKPALRLVHSNAYTDVIERTIKAGHVMSGTKLEKDESGRLLQHGQALETIDANAHRYASESWQMKRRASAETRNRFRIEMAHRQELLKDYFFFVPSRAADDMSSKHMEDTGFFTDTMSCALQVTTENENGEVVVESAFVAGKSDKGAPRHDEQTIVEMGKRLGVDYSGMSAVEILDTPLLVHKSLMPNGVIDLVKLYDDCAGGTFFGQAKPRQDYLEYLEFCRERERGFGPVVQEIVHQLVSEADMIHTPLDAVRRLHELSQQKTLRHAIEKDKSIDPRVFGEQAAPLIVQARLHHSLGNQELSMTAAIRAQRVAKSSSCPSEIKNNKNSLKSEIELESPDYDNLDREELENGSEPETVASKIRCINCRKNVPKKLVVKKDCWECPKCQHKVDICSGKVLKQGMTAASTEETIGNVIFASFGNVEAEAT